MTTHTPGRVPEMLRANLTNEEFAQLVIEAENLRADLRACKAISIAMEGAAHDLRVQRDELLAALVASALEMEQYMNYHDEKFYAGVTPKPTGLRPAIATARAVIARATGEQQS